MTAYNRQQFIGEAIESVLASTYQNWELIIVDDCSKDDTVAIAKSYAGKDDRIKVYVNEKNLGDYPNRNRAASYSKTEFIMFCDSDDKMLADTIPKMLQLVNLTPDFNFAMQWSHSPETFVIEPNEALRKHFFEQQFLYIGPGGTFIRRTFFDAIGGYPEKYGPANDMYFNLKVACNTAILLIPFDLVFYRRHDGQEINNYFSYMYNNYMYLRDALVELPLPFTSNELEWLKKKNKRRFAVQLLKHLLINRNFKKIKEACTLTTYSFNDFIQGLLYFKKHPKQL
ncbi:MAG: glycosyltransferase family 2 protein [Niastella sp.]|nr:glycosyltransferase family 2 protein [Niastella sp.]